jgi:PIN domain nuclease of toxin-antitoxin system
MRFLLDTHVWLWLQLSPEVIESSVLDQLADDSNELLLSAASSWEIAIKYGLGKLPLPEPPDVYVPSAMRHSGTSGLAIEPMHTLAVAKLPPLHRDPFDRLLVVQAQMMDLTLVTADPLVAAYDVTLLTIDRRAP